MDAMTLKAILTLDSSQYESGLMAAKGAAGKLGSVIGTGLKVAGAAVGAATAAVGAFAKSSVDAGMSFDNSMSAVAATMGFTVDQLNDANSEASKSYQQLSEFAMEMGRTTKYSATEAADALNYMALAGYTVDESMQMLPNVLNLAAAGDMELARASDMVTDTQTAMGLSFERTSLLVDEMAKAASTGNTSVEQLGDAFLTVGGLAQELNGGLVQTKSGAEIAVDGVQELEIAFTAMADAGIKGSEAGTHMRNMLLKLAGPTSEGTVQLEKMGVEVFDLEGNMRSLKDIFSDLSVKMGEMTQEDKLNAIKNLFNTRDTASAEALLKAVGDDWDRIGEKILEAKIPLEEVKAKLKETGVEFGTTIKANADQFAADIREMLTTEGKSAAETAAIIADSYDMSMGDAVKSVNAVKDAIDEATGAAENMAKERMNNLKGDIDLWNSALETAKILISNEITPSLREFVQFGTDGVSRMADAFRSGGFSAAMKEFGTILSEGLGMITKELPNAMKAGGELLKALGQGIKDNMPIILAAAKDITTEFVSFVTSAAPEFISFGIDVLTFIGQGIMENIDLIISSAIEIITQLVTALVEALPQLLEAGIQIIVGIATGIAENLPELIPTITEVIITIITTLLENIDLLIDAAVQLMIGLANGFIQAMPIIIEKIPEIIQGIVDALMNNIPALLAAAIEIHMALAQAVVENAPLILDAILQVFAMIGELLINAGAEWVTNMATAMSNLKSTVEQWMSQLPERMGYFAGLMLAKTIEFVQQLPGKITEIFNNVMTSVQNFGQKFIAEGPKMANEFKQKLIEFMKSIPPKMIEIGHDIVDGLKNGISNAWESFKGWMGEMVSGFIDGVKEGLKIGSPSKVMADEVGKWIPAGIAVGIEDNMGVLDNAMNAMYDAVTPDYISATSAGTASIDLATVINLLQSINENTAEPIKLEGDMDRIFRVMQSKATANYRLTGNKSMVTA